MKRDTQWFAQGDAELGAARSLLSAAILSLDAQALLVERCRAAAQCYVKALLTRDGTEFPEKAGLLELLDLADLGFLPSDLAPLAEGGDSHRAIACVNKVKQAVLDAITSG